MMNAVHARRHDEANEPSLGPDRKTRVGVVEEDRGEENGLPHPHFIRAHTDDDDLRYAIEDRQREFTKMKPQRCRRVEIEVDVVRKVEAPEEWHLMVRAVPPPQRVVHE